MIFSLTYPHFEHRPVEKDIYALLSCHSRPGGHPLCALDTWSITRSGVKSKDGQAVFFLLRNPVNTEAAILAVINALMDRIVPTCDGSPNITMP